MSSVINAEMQGFGSSNGRRTEKDKKKGIWREKNWPNHGKMGVSSSGYRIVQSL
jgi:hypothetical protein